MKTWLRCDGEFTIYSVQIDRSPTVNPDERWVDWTAYAHAYAGIPTVPVRYANVQDQRRHNEQHPFCDFSANGECWQRLGVYGVFDLQLARDLVVILLKYNPQRRVRIVSRRVTQQTRVLLTCQSKPPEPEWSGALCDGVQYD